MLFSDGFGLGLLHRFAKRGFDIVVSSLLLLVTLPITLPTALLIRLESKGPIFYRQERVGLHGKSFMVLKFRSMRTDAEINGPRWAAKNDARVTAVGRFIRKVRIDEIPQVINVLKGDMAFVGPRPERPVFVRELSRTIPYYNERHAIKPGITGWAQINYPYGATEYDAKMKLAYDLYSIKNGSIFLDIIIMMQTVKAIIWNDGAR
jgi:exopolysaccharide biosynthesis polyprenyl glycosylphosphotransferase